MQINELPRVIRTAPMIVLTPIFFFSIANEVKLVVSKVNELVKITATERELVLRCMP